MTAPRRISTAVVSLSKRPASRRIVVAGALLAAAGSVYIGAVRATTPGAGFGSGDFQWSPTRLLLHGIDPYAARMAGSEDIILTQSPNYLHLLYWVLTPFGALPFVAALWSWMVLNVLLSVGLGLWYGRMAHLGRAGSLLITAALLCSTPFRLGLSNGQHAVVVLACATVAFAAAQRPWAGPVLALALTKYSFAPFGLVLLVKGRLRALLVAALTLLLAAGGMSLVTGTALGTVLMEPFRLSRAVVGDGAADVMTVLSLTPWFSSTSPALTVIGVLTAAASTVCLARVLRDGDWVFGLGVAAMISLVSFKHLTHDFVLLLPVVVLLLRMRGPRAWLGWAALGYHWLLLGVLAQFGTAIDTPAVIVVSFFVLVALLVLVASTPTARWAELQRNALPTALPEVRNEGVAGPDTVAPRRPANLDGAARPAGPQAGLVTGSEEARARSRAFTGPTEEELTPEPSA